MDGMTPEHMRELIMIWHTEYSKSRRFTIKSPIIRDGIEFWGVRVNSTHEFFVGTKDGTVYRCSYELTGKDVSGLNSWSEIEEFDQTKMPPDHD